MIRTQANPTDTGSTDSEERYWLAAHAGGDTEAFSRLVTAYRGFVMTLLWRSGVGPASRDDLFQEIFLKIHHAAASYRPEQPLRPWLATIVMNEVRNHRRTKGRQSHFLSALLHASNQDHRAHQDTGADHVLEHATTLTWLEKQISELSERQREVLVLSTTKGLGMKDIARVMVLPENTVKTHLRRARLALAEALSHRETEEN